MFSKIAHHAALTHAMGQKTGYDIPQALESGKLHDSQLEAMIRRCTTCEKPEICGATLQAPGPVPEFCKNRSIFSAD